MKFLKWLGIILVIIIALFFIIPLFLPSTFHVERSIEIEKSPLLVFKTAVDMDQRSVWDPWIEMEPDVEMKVTMTPNIIGSGYYWNGAIIGEGKLYIKEFVPNERIKSELEFISPRRSKADAIWTFKKTEKGTLITWGFEGNLSYPVEKWMGLFMDKMMAPSFEKGLSNFKTLVESKEEMKGRTGEISEIDFSGVSAMAIKEKCSMDILNSKMLEMYSSLMKYLRDNNEDISGFPFAIYHPTDEEGKIILECALPVQNKLANTEQIKYIELPASKTVMASHFGHYNTVSTTHDALMKYIKQNNLEIAGSPFEVYLTNPMLEPDDSKWETKIYFPIK